MSDEGGEVKRRRERIGMTISDLAERSQVNRDTVSAIEHGKGYRADRLTAIHHALDDLEEEMGLGPIEDDPAAEPRVAVFKIEGSRGGRVVVEVPVEDADRLLDTVLRLRREMEADDASMDE